MPRGRKARCRSHDLAFATLSPCPKVGGVGEVPGIPARSPRTGNGTGSGLGWPAVGALGAVNELNFDGSIGHHWAVKAVAATGGATRAGSVKSGTGTLRKALRTSTSRGRTHSEGRGTMLDGRTWDELPVERKPHDQALPLWQAATK